MNPQHTVPVLVDGKLVITESRAAITYLCSEYKSGQLYPADPERRSQIDQRLFFNIGTFYKRFGDCVYPVCFGKSKIIEEEKKNALKEALRWVDEMVTDGYVLGSSMSIADVDFMSTLSTLEACSFLDLSQYKNVKKWSKQMKKTIPNFSENCEKGALAFGKWFNSNYSKNDKFKHKLSKTLGKGFSIFY
eukprot:TRINITY_DN14559_c0_g1_i2.p1 TRINITY_DN14559_c0_g1~~TRINITY_DN14559_c0_g1_i2.p1  ORF type:complete len:190 (-),score=46.77 TRINITY_DN14559_c0_g1_i2:286-855(-)